ncbi:tetratricopeptide repeat protein [Alienimonas chondri]|uniref:Tetratricopeptide repeat protein n=1 Tax=Alienimonas chondri TaxID=2681879 RepID=A0ABX1VHM5_9PLAN|nr:tetratricopeptide repeat protein [Alienimonas chondri]NNJ27639.1 hypothetical protein [Alienimonas chondri]
MSRFVCPAGCRGSRRSFFGARTAHHNPSALRRFVRHAALLCVATLAPIAASAQSILLAPPSPLQEAAPPGGAGLFVGVNEFTDPSGKVGNLRFAVNDAVELAHLFALELRLIPAANCTLALSGEAEGETAQAHLDALKANGATVTTANAVPILDALASVSSKGREPNDLLIIACSSHGFSEGERAYLMPRDGRFAFLDRTAVPLETLEGTVRRSKAGHRLLLIDACQDRVSATRGLGGRQAATAMSDTFAAALAKPTGQAKLASCEVGQFSLELPSLKQGVFTAALLDSLRGGASDADGDGFVRLAEVQTATTARVSSLIAEYNRDLPEADHIRQSPTFHGPEATRSLPLAVPATDVAILIEKLARRVGQQGYTEELHARLSEELTAETAPADLRREAERFADRGGRFFAVIAAQILTPSDAAMRGDSDAVARLEKAKKAALLGSEHYAAERYDSAASAFREAAEADPGEGMFHFYLGDALQETGDHAAALAALEKAIELMPQHALSRYYAGLSHHNLGDYQAAVKRYREALAIDDSDPTMHQSYGLALRLLGLEEQAVEQFAIAAADNPELGDPNAAAGGDPPMAGNEPPAAPAAFRQISSFKELAGEWKAEFTVTGNNNFRMLDTTRIDQNGNLSSSRIIYTYDANGNEQRQTQIDRSRMILDGNQILLGTPGQVFTRHNYKYNGDEFHIEYTDLGGTVIWYRQQ